MRMSPRTSMMQRVVSTLRISYANEDECQDPITQEDLDAELPDVDKPWDEEAYEFYEDLWNEVYVHEIGTEDIPENYVSFYYDDEGNYVEADPEELEYDDDEEYEDDYAEEEEEEEEEVPDEELEDQAVL